MPREGNKGGSQKKGGREEEGTRNVEVASQKKKHEHCIGSEVKDSSDTFKSCRGVIK